MSTENTKGILVVSFGTSYPETRAKTIDVIEADIAAAFPDCRVYRAWTSKMIIKKLKKRDNIHIDTVAEALERMQTDGIDEVIIQPTHMINGIENNLMKKAVEPFMDKFVSVRFGAPLLTGESDNQKVVQIVGEEFSGLSDREALVLMGHGTCHYVNSIYAALDYTFKDMGYKNIFVGTVEAYPALDNTMKQLAEFKPERIILAPFMIVAGDHANNDLNGDEPDSWKSRLTAAGYQVDCVLKGLGEYPDIRRLLVEHVRASV